MNNVAQIRKDNFKIGGIVTGVLTIPTTEVGKLVISGVGDVYDPIKLTPGERFAAAYMDPEFSGAGIAAVIPDLEDEQVSIFFGGKHNAFVNQGLQRVLDSAYNGLTAVRITHIGLSADAQTVTAATTSLDPAGGATGTSIKTTANVSRTSQTVHADQTWTQADVAFAIAKIGLLTSSAATDVVNIIGGTGGASPYNEPFTIDLTSIATWSLTMGIDVTATAS